MPTEVQMEMSKEQKEKWIIDHFLVTQARQGFGAWKIIEKTMPPWPDFLIGNVGERRHVEVTELFEAPSSGVGRQRVLQKEFDRFVERTLQSDKYRGIWLMFHKHDLPSKKGIEKHTTNIFQTVDNLIEKHGRKSEWEFRAKADGRPFRVSFSPVRNEADSVKFLFGSMGVVKEDEKAYFNGLCERMQDKADKVYELVHSASLVIYDNCHYSMFIHDAQRDVLPQIQGEGKGQFDEVWLLRSDGATASRLV